MCLLPSPHNSTAAGPLTYNKTERRTKGGGGGEWYVYKAYKGVRWKEGEREGEGERGVCTGYIYESHRGKECERYT